MLYNSYAVTSYTYEDYKKTSYARSGSAYAAKEAPCPKRLALKILAVALLVIIAVTAGLKLAPSAEKVNASDSHGYVETAETVDTESNTIYF